MKILILNWRDYSHPKSGGAEIVTMEHASEWVKKGHKVTWFTSAYSGSSNEEIIDGVNIIHRAGSLTVYLFAPIYLILNGNKFDVIIDEIHGIPFFSPLWTRTPKIVFIHEIAGEIWDYMYRFPISYIGKKLESWYFKLYRNTFFWTDAPSTISELVERGIDRNRCVAIPCPIPTQSQKYILKSLDKFQKEINPTYIFISRVVKMKGIEEVIKAFSFIVKVQSKAKLWIVGGGESEYINSLKTMIRDYGVENQVIFWSKVSERQKFELLAKAHILLHASVKEGWGLVVLESASQGTPAVVYNVAGLKDVVKSGKTGDVILNNSPQEMASAAVNLFSDNVRYKIYQKNCRQWAMSLSWRDAVNQSMLLLDKVAKKSI
jgi:glycosyltransferase involved in cell wall biosynthesis